MPAPSQPEPSRLEALIAERFRQLETDAGLHELERLYQVSLRSVPLEVQRVYALCGLARDLSLSEPRLGLTVCELLRVHSDAIGYAPGLAWYGRELGSIHHELGELDAAVEHLTLAVERHEALGVQAGLASSINVLGHVWAHRGDYGRALEAYAKYVEIARELGRPQSEAIGLANVAETHLDLGEPWRALEATLESRRVLTELQSNREAQAWLLGNLARAYHGLGQRQRAVHTYREALEMQRVCSDNGQVVKTLRLLAEVLAHEGNVAEASALMAEACQLNSEHGNQIEQAELCVVNARLHRMTGQAALALEHALQALNMARQHGERNTEVRALLELAALQPDEAVPLLEDALRKALEVGIRPGILDVRLALVQALEVRGQPEDVRAALGHLHAQRDIDERIAQDEAEHRIQNLSVQYAIGVAERETALERQRREALEAANAALETANQENAQLLGQLREQAVQLERLASEDALTGVANRRTLEREMNRELERARRYHHPLSVAFCDIDHFKRVNDRFSHAVGDLVLQQIARLLTQHSRRIDLVARYGGEEFVLVMPETSLEAAVQACEHIRAQVQAFDWSTIRAGLEITMSFGLNANTLSPDANAMLDLADAQLYVAKQTGRNRVAWLGQSTPA